MFKLKILVLKCGFKQFEIEQFKEAAVWMVSKRGEFNTVHENNVASFLALPVHISLLTQHIQPVFEGYRFRLCLHLAHVLPCIVLPDVHNPQYGTSPLHTQPLLPDDVDVAGKDDAVGGQVVPGYDVATLERTLGLIDCLGWMEQLIWNGGKEVANIK